MVWRPLRRNQGLSVQETVTGTATSASLPQYAQGYTAPLNLISVTSDNLAASATGLGGATSVVDGLTVSHVFGGSAAKGSRSGISSNLTLTAATGNSGEPVTNAFYNGMGATVRMSSADGGTVGTPRGYASGVFSQVQLQAAATNWATVFAWGEGDLVVSSGASVTNKLGFEILLATGDAVQGSNMDAAVLIGDTGSVGWTTLFEVGFPPGQGGRFPLDATNGQVMWFPQSGSAKNGINFSNVTFSNCAMQTLNNCIGNSTLAVGSTGLIGVGTVFQATAATNDNLTVKGHQAAAAGPTIACLNGVGSVIEPCEIQAAPLIVTNGGLLVSSSGNDPGVGNITASGNITANGVFKAGSNSGVSCGTGVFNPATSVVSNGIITHC